YSSYNGILYSCSNGKDKNKISDDVYSVYATATAAYYYANYDSSKCIYDVYASNGNANFSCIAEEINHYEY
ncbi:MAG: hypothetical protein IMZ64_00110, partial [Bacteroidetes bacterium]|nr:hypothetical protein [Bacteroidota bacterium]